jgi:hypothetical protein
MSANELHALRLPARHASPTRPFLQAVCSRMVFRIAVFRELLSRYAIKPLPEESLADTVARTAGNQHSGTEGSVVGSERVQSIPALQVGTRPY